MDDIYVKTPNQDSVINTGQVNTIMDYLLRKYKGINTRSIVSEYDVLTLQTFNL